MAFLFLGAGLCTEVCYIFNSSILIDYVGWRSICLWTSSAPPLSSSPQRHLHQLLRKRKRGRGASTAGHDTDHDSRRGLRFVDHIGGRGVGAGPALAHSGTRQVQHAVHFLQDERIGVFRGKRRFAVAVHMAVAYHQ